MKSHLFTNVRIFDGSGAPPFDGEVLVQDNRIVDVAKTAERRIERAGATVHDGGGATLMPGLVEAHAHLTWPSAVDRIVHGMYLPPEELMLTAARNARLLLDHGYTGAYSGGALGKRIEVALKREIDGGWIPGPRLIPSTIERQPPNEQSELQMGDVEDHAQGPDAVRGWVATCKELGVQSVKFLLSGEDALKPGTSQQLLYTEEEIAAAGDEARRAGVWLTGHAHAADAVKLGLKHGFRVLYHCSLVDEEALDMLEERRGEVFVAPSVGILQATIEASPPPHFDMSGMKRNAEETLALYDRLIPEWRRRGVRVLPGGDYGFPFNPHGRNARDLELFVTRYGHTPAEALVAATRLGGEIMGRGDELGQIRPGYLADLLLVDGDPTRDIAILQDRARLLAIMQDGRFHKAPPRMMAA